MRSTIPLLGLLPGVAFGQQAFSPKPGNFPANGDDPVAGGIFSISLTDLNKYLSGGFGTGAESPKGTGQVTTGTGPYPAQMLTDASLPSHTVYAPKTAPNISMPFIAWGNGGCSINGAEYRNLLTEIASYGYVIAADGAPTPGAVNGIAGGPQSKVTDMRDSIDWAMKGGAAKYGTIDTTKIATAGHSCGGLEAYSVSYKDPRVKLLALFNIGIFQDDRRYLLQEIKVPIAYLLGGSKDLGYAGVSVRIFVSLKKKKKLFVEMFVANRAVTRPRKTTRLFPQDFPQSRVILTQVIAELTRLPMVANRAKLRLHGSSGSLGEMPSLRPCGWNRAPQGVSFRTSGRLNRRTGLKETRRNYCIVLRKFTRHMDGV